MFHIHDVQQIISKNEIITYEMADKPWKIVGAGIFSLNNGHLYYIVDNHSKLPPVKRMEDLPADQFIKCCKFVPAEYGLPCRILSGGGTNFISDKFKTFCQKLNMLQSVSLSYSHQINDQAEVCIKFIKRTMKNA